MFDLNKKTEILAKKSKLKAELVEMVRKLMMTVPKDMLVYQPTLGTLELQKDNSVLLIMLLAGNQKVYLFLLFLHNIPILYRA